MITKLRFLRVRIKIQQVARQPLIAFGIYQRQKFTSSSLVYRGWYVPILQFTILTKLLSIHVKISLRRLAYQLRTVFGTHHPLFHMKSSQVFHSMYAHTKLLTIRTKLESSNARIWIKARVSQLLIQHIAPSMVQMILGMNSHLDPR